MSIRFVVKLSFDPNKQKPTDLDFSRFAVEKIETGDDGKSKTDKIGYLDIVKSDEDHNSSVCFIPNFDYHVNNDEQKDIFDQAGKLVPLLDRLWLVHNYQKLSDELERTARVLSGLDMLPPGLEDPSGLYRHLGKIAAKTRRLLAKPLPDGGHEFYDSKWRETYPDIPERISGDLLFKVRWAYHDSGLPVPKSTEKKISKKLDELEDLRGHELENYLAFLRRSGKNER